MEFSFIHAVDAQGDIAPDAIAFFNSRGESISYGELKRKSDALARWIAAEPAFEPGVPLVVYGHKSPLMLVYFLACVKSGHAYVPVDVLYPRERVANIIGQLGQTAVLDTIGTIPEVMGELLERPHFDIAALPAAHYAQYASAPAPACVGPEDTFYILFTSGSTGTPKGVQIIAECMDNFSNWLLNSEFALDKKRVWFNRSPFTFDLSVTDLAWGLPHGDTLFALEDEAEKSLALTFEALSQSGITDWVSTPSVLDQMLSDEKFDASLIPTLKRTYHVGEVLRPETVSLAKQRFPGLQVFNGYGPTESTDFVTLCEITPEMLADDRSLPIGYTKPGTELVVLDPETLEPVPDGEHGELFVIGNTVARGYWGREDLTEAAFHSCPESIARGRRSYRTGDEIARDPSGMFYYHGRYDLQIKLHGYRIELGDIEATLCSLPEVNMACVLPIRRDGQISHLVAVIVLADADAPRGFAQTKLLKQQVRPILPPYMVPRTFKYVDAIPLNQNGKADRKALVALIDG